MAIFTKVENIFYVSMSTEATENNFLLKLPFIETYMLHQCHKKDNLHYISIHEHILFTNNQFHMYFLLFIKSTLINVYFL